MKRLRTAIRFLAWALAAGTARAAPEYWATDLGTLGGTGSVALGINELSQVVGWAKDSSGRTQAFVWQNGTMTGLGFLPGGSNSAASAINDLSEITGYSYVSGTKYHTFHYTNGIMVDLGTLGGSYSEGRAINDQGDIAGSSTYEPTDYSNATFLWRSNQLIHIPAYHNISSCDGFGINAEGRVCGSTYLYATELRYWGYVWFDSNGNGTNDTDEMTVLGSLGTMFSIGSASQAFSINDIGQVVGWTSITNDYFPRHAFIVSPSNGQWKIPVGGSTNLLMQDLGALDGFTNNSYANAINNRSWIVGTSTTGSGTNQAFLWRDGVMTNLNDLIPTNSGWALTNATGINEYNEIVGAGLFNGQRRAFILHFPGLAVLGTNGMIIADSEPPSRLKGSDYGDVEFGTAVTNAFALRNAGTNVVAISGWTTNGTGASSFQFSGIPAAIEIGGVSNFACVFTPTLAGAYAAALDIESDSPVSTSNILFAGNGTLPLQSIDFPPIPDQWATNVVGLIATASSGLAVEFAVAFGPAQIADLTNLTFTGAGPVGIVASQDGSTNWNAAPDVTNVFNVSKVPASVALDDLAQTYDGTARIASATTEPEGLAVEFTYAGNGWAPTNAGSYAVTGTIVEAQWEGATNGLLVVFPADQAIVFPPLGDQYVTNAVGLSATAESGLPVEFSVLSGPAQIDGFTNLTFTGIGPVAIVAVQSGDANWNPAPDVTNAFAVRKMPASVVLHELEQTYDGTARIASATTEPEGLAVELTYEGNAWAPTNAGTYAVTGTVVDAQWEGATNGPLVVARADQVIDFQPIPDQFTTNAVGLSATAGSGFTVAFSVASGPAQIDGLTNLTFTGIGEVSIVASQAGDANWNPAPDVTNVFAVSKMPASVVLHELEQTYDGTARVVSATTDPEGLAVEFTYDGNPWAPTNAGTYAVTGTIVEAHWEGSTNGLLVVSPADQAIDFPPLGDQHVTNAVGLSATADSGLPVEFSVLSGPAQIDGPTNLTFTSTGLVAIVASQAGDANWNPAPAATNVFAVYGLHTLTVLSDYGLPDPPVGIHTNFLDAVLTNSIAVPEPQGATQIVCAGWALIGHEPATGLTNRFEMTVTNDATLVWRWATNYWLETVGDEHGTLTPSNSWQPAGLPALLVPQPQPYYHFTHWTGSASGTNYPFALFMDLPKSVQAHFAENLAIHDVPEWWLAEHGWTTDFDAAALRDDEPDGFPSWQEFVADTDPTNAASYPRIASIVADVTNYPVVTWPASTGRAYRIHRADDILDSPWITQEVSIGVGEWTDTNPPPPVKRYYRLEPLRP